jgi:rhomboid protease GluP
LVLQEYGSYRTISIYVLGGVLGFLISALAGVNFTIGASASLCALIGAMLYYGKSRGGSYGQAVFREIGGWAVGIAMFGFFFPGINNWGHGGGMAAGALLAMLFGYLERRREGFTDKLIAAGCVLATLLVVLWMGVVGLAALLL